MACVPPCAPCGGTPVNSSGPVNEQHTPTTLSSPPWPASVPTVFFQLGRGSAASKPVLKPGRFALIQDDRASTRASVARGAAVVVSPRQPAWFEPVCTPTSSIAVPVKRRAGPPASPLHTPLAAPPAGTRSKVPAATPSTVAGADF